MHAEHPQQLAASKVALHVLFCMRAWLAGLIAADDVCLLEWVWLDGDECLRTPWCGSSYEQRLRAVAARGFASHVEQYFLNFLF